MKRALIFILAIFLVSCAGSNFNEGMSQLNSINEKYGTSMDTYPDTTGKMASMIGEISKLKDSSQNKAFRYAADYRILNIEAEKFYSESQKYGKAGSTKEGFSCKPRPLVLESADLRIKSASKAYGAVDALRALVKEYPEEALSLGLSEKNALFINATFYLIEAQAKTDIKVINNFCPENRTLEIYRQEFRSKNLMTEEEIESITYEQAAALWKKERGY